MTDSEWKKTLESAKAVWEISGTSEGVRWHFRELIQRMEKMPDHERTHIFVEVANSQTRKLLQNNHAPRQLAVILDATEIPAAGQGPGKDIRSRDRRVEV